MSPGIRSAIVGLIGAVGGSFLLPPSAHAYILLGCEWSQRSIRFSVPAPLLSSPYWTSAADLWDGLNAGLVGAGADPDLASTNKNCGNTVSWSGVTRRPGTVQSRPTCTSSGYWVSGQMEVVMNWSGTSGYSASRRRMVAAHELGHAFGLGDTTANPHLLMYCKDTRTVLVPQQNDWAGVNAIYP